MSKSDAAFVKKIEFDSEFGSRSHASHWFPPVLSLLAREGLGDWNFKRTKLKLTGRHTESQLDFTSPMRYAAPGDDALMLLLFYDFKKMLQAF